jgi:hypothetical protein
MPDETSKQVSSTVFSVLAAICIGLSSFALKWSFDANAEMKAMTVQMQHMATAMEKMNQKTELDKKQDSSIAKHWKLHNWAREEINTMRFEDGKAPVAWPDLSGSDWDR